LKFPSYQDFLTSAVIVSEGTHPFTHPSTISNTLYFSLNTFPISIIEPYKTVKNQQNRENYINNICTDIVRENLRNQFEEVITKEKKTERKEFL
jgi:hypothetical protein